MATASDGDLAFHEQRRDSDHESFLAHKRMRWLKVALVLSLAAIVGYLLAAVEPRPNGGSWYGYTLGTIGAYVGTRHAPIGRRQRNGCGGVAVRLRGRGIDRRRGGREGVCYSMHPVERTERTRAEGSALRQRRGP